MTHIEKMWKTIEKAEKEYVGQSDSYDLSTEEACALIDCITECHHSGVFNVFNLCFHRGVRWPRAQDKKQAEKA